jgi:predicted transcriptional regulator YheO
MTEKEELQRLRDKEQKQKQQNKEITARYRKKNVVSTVEVYSDTKEYIKKLCVKLNLSQKEVIKKILEAYLKMEAHNETK